MKGEAPKEMRSKNSSWQKRGILILGLLNLSSTSRVCIYYTYIITHTHIMVGYQYIIMLHIGIGQQGQTRTTQVAQDNAPSGIDKRRQRDNEQNNRR